MKPTRCPNQNCDSHSFEAVPMFQCTDHAAYIIQCAKCGTPIGAVNSTFPITAAIGNIEAKLTASRSI
jgi:hypothetical protein